ncbi:MAG: O-antigen ligase family protein [Verrucomicrobiota bacterium]
MKEVKSQPEAPRALDEGKIMCDVLGGGNWIRAINRGYLCLLLFLAPLKFGLVVGTMEVSLFPTTTWEWLLTVWPPWLLPPLAGVGLILSLAASRRVVCPRGVGLVSWVWLLVLAGALPGLVRTTEWDTAQQFVWHLIGAACMALAVRRTVQADREARGWLLAAVVAGGVLAALSGWNQVVFGGYERTLAGAREQGVALSSAMVDRMTQGRASGPFVYPNSLAAHLVLVLPMALVALWRAASWFEPVRVSRGLFVFCGGAALGIGLVLSGSRAGIAAGVAGVVCAIALMPGLRRWRMPVLLLVLAFGVAAGVAINRGRGLSSLEARGDYYRACVQMGTTHPATGVGLGEFFPWYMHLKPEAAENTRRPHSFLLGFFAQSGVFGAVAAMVCLSLPLWFRRALRGGGWTIDAAMGLAVLAGTAAWSLHSLLDFNVHIPGTLATVAALPFLCGAPSEEGVPASTGGQRSWRGTFALAIVAILGIWRVPGELAYARQTTLMQAPQVAAKRRVARAAEQACRLLPLSPYPCWLRGLYARQNGDSDEAIRAFEQTVRRAPHREAFRKALIEELRAVGNSEKARQVAEKDWKP